MVSRIRFTARLRPEALGVLRPALRDVSKGRNLPRPSPEMTNIDRRARDTDRLGYSSVAALSFAGANQGGQPNTKRSSYLSELRTAEHQSTVFRPRNRARVHVRPSGQFGSRPTLLFTEVPEHCPEI